jgi:hypothetical protein
MRRATWGIGPRRLGQLLGDVDIEILEGADLIEDHKQLV